MTQPTTLPPSSMLPSPILTTSTVSDAMILDHLTQQTRTLQYLQMLMNDHQSRVTLVEVTVLVQAMQQQYGVAATLEHVIQSLVSLHVHAQMQSRRRIKEGSV